MHTDVMGYDPLAERLTALRRELHRYPEPAWYEYRTTCRVIRELQQQGIPVLYGRALHCPKAMYGLPDDHGEALQRAREEGCDEKLLAQLTGGYTGCVAVIRGDQPGKTVAVRVDLDCNRLAESGDEAHRPVREGFASHHEGCMHGCGHDGHTAIGVCLAESLWARRGELRGQVKIIFQPAEEGAGGAASMTAAGVLDGVDIFLGMHIGLGLEPVGTIAASAYGFLASTKMDVTFHGRGAHAGLCPEEGRNALAAAATAVTNLLAISRSGQGASRVNVGSLVSVAGRNVIPSEARMGVETRGETETINAYMESSALRVCEAAAAMYGCTVEHRIMGRAGSADCSSALAKRVCEFLGRQPGVIEVVPAFHFRASEDVTTMMRRVQEQGGQATELMLGSAIAAPHHSERFDFDEAVMPLAVRTLTQLILTLVE